MAGQQLDPQSLALETEQLLHRAEFHGAIASATRLVRLRPKDEHALALLATAELSAGRPAPARARLERALRTLPDSARLTRLLGSALRLEGKADAAMGAFERAIELAPDDHVAQCALAEMRLLRGDAEGAMRTLEPIVESGAWDVNAAVVHAMICLSLKREADAIGPVERVLDDPDTALAGRVELLYRLGSLRERLHLYDAAFEACDEANRLQRVPHDPDATSRAVDEAIECWTPEAIAALPRAATDASRVVLIVGMPRSGTSLVEQVLSSHPDVYGGDERGFLTQLAMQLDPPARGQFPIIRSPSRIRRQTLARASRRYLRMLDDLAAGEARVTDKMPINSFHLGLVQVLLPGARVIHCTRDPLDTCLSCYFTGFSPSLSFAFNLEHLGRFHRVQERLMDHWDRVLDLPTMRVPYESMVDDQEAITRGLIDFVGLPWDDACLRFHEADRVQMTSSNQQVRQPIYRSSLRRHEHFASHLGPLRQALGSS